jgi:hypothetical protein
MNDQSVHIVKQFGEFALKIQGNVISSISVEDVGIIKELMKLNIDKRVLGTMLGSLFTTYDGLTVPYKLYYNIICGQISTEESPLNGMILRTLCCDGEHKKEKEFLMASDAISEEIKTALKNVVLSKNT